MRAGKRRGLYIRGAFGMNYVSLLDHMPEGFASCRVDFEDNQPRDLIFIAANKAFEKLTGLNNVVGKTLTEIIPEIARTHPEVFKVCGRVVSTGNPERFEHYLESTNVWLGIMVCQPEEDHIAAIVDDITGQKRLEREVLEVSEIEQKRLGQELHDDLGQQLTGLSMIAALVAKSLRREGFSQAFLAENLVGMFNDTINSTKNLAKGFYPIELERGGFIMAISELTQRLTLQTRISCKFQHDDSFQVSKEKEIHLYRIVQEAINNSVKHGKPRNILVECILMEGIPTLRITDDGVGFQQLEGGKAGMGLHLFEYRARIVGAKIKVEKCDNGGCQVTCSLGFLAQ